jgi:hypothetical protein
VNWSTAMADHIHISAEGTLNAPSSTVYNIIADYHTGHPLIVPKPYFQRIEVESGGVGAGTTMIVTMRVLGITSRLRHQVSEPEPGRVLVESDVEWPDTGDQTTFTVTSVSAGSQAHVSIATEMKAHPGIRGQLERRLIPPVLRPAYQKELRLLEAEARRRMVMPSNVSDAPEAHTS